MVWMTLFTTKSDGWPVNHQAGRLAQPLATSDERGIDGYARIRVEFADRVVSVIGN